jgi:hypothetical protein
MEEIFEEFMGKFIADLESRKGVGDKLEIDRREYDKGHVEYYINYNHRRILKFSFSALRHKVYYEKSGGNGHPIYGNENILYHLDLDELSIEKVYEQIRNDLAYDVQEMIEGYKVEMTYLEGYLLLVGEVDGDH